jgi:hypothetical protein
VSINPVAVEKLAHHGSAEIGSRQEALQTIFSGLLDIFYVLIFGFIQKTRLLQQAHGLSPAIFQFGIGSAKRISRQLTG